MVIARCPVRVVGAVGTGVADLGHGFAARAAERNTCRSVGIPSDLEAGIFFYWQPEEYLGIDRNTDLPHWEP